MWPVLFRIPLDRPWNLGPLGEVPGFCCLLSLWVLMGVVAFVLHRRENGWKMNISDEPMPFILWFCVAVVIVIGAPRLGMYLRENGSPNFRDGLPVFGYGVMLFTGLSTAVTLASKRALREGLDVDIIWDLAIWLVVPGIIGARLYYLIQYHDRVFSNVPSSEWLMTAVNLSQGGIVLYGGLIGGAIGYFAFCYFRHLRPLGLADIVVPSVFIGIGFGRIGCFLYGCCYGAACSLPWAVRFPRDSATFASMVEKGLIDINAPCTPSLHPTQIYSSIDGFIIAAITSWYFWHRRRNGEVLAVALMIYPVTRFCMEFLRADEVGQLNTTLTTAQLISIALFVVNIGFMIYLSRRPAILEPVILPTANSKPLATAG